MSDSLLPSFPRLHFASTAGHQASCFWVDRSGCASSSASAHEPASQCTRGKKRLPMFANIKGTTVFEFWKKNNTNPPIVCFFASLIFSYILITKNTPKNAHVWHFPRLPSDCKAINFPRLQNQYSVRLPINSLCICEPGSYNTLGKKIFQHDSTWATQKIWPYFPLYIPINCLIGMRLQWFMK